ncbi:MAG: hypothetical protein K2L73_02620, partial [Muribaculaceae bacterium]|nr:hypothetical protein [Muribaculaceae bacterium]
PYAGGERMSVYAAASQATDSVAVSLYFRQGSHILDTAYRGNTDSIAKVYTALTSKDSARVTAIDIRSGASPEGNSNFNRLLSDNRAVSATSILSTLPGFEPQIVRVNSVGEDWDTFADNIIACKSMISTPPHD